MKRLLLVPLVLLPLAACGDDDDGAASPSASASVDADAASGDFCEIWPEANSGSIDLDEGELPTEGELDEAREQIALARASAPAEIEGEVDALLDAVEGIVDSLDSGEEPDMEELFGEVFALAFSAGVEIEEWLVENCPDYEPQAGFIDEGESIGGQDESSIDEADEGDAADEGDDMFADSLGALEIPQPELEALQDEVFASASGWSFDGSTYQVYIDDPSEALGGCEAFSDRASAHASASGSVVLEVLDADSDVLVRNETLAAGDAGECVAV